MVSPSDSCRPDATGRAAEERAYHSGDTLRRQPVRAAMVLLLAAEMREAVGGGDAPEGRGCAALRQVLGDGAAEAAEHAVLLERDDRARLVGGGVERRRVERLHA